MSLTGHRQVCQFQGPWQQLVSCRQQLISCRQQAFSWLLQLSAELSSQGLDCFSWQKPAGLHLLIPLEWKGSGTLPTVLLCQGLHPSSLILLLLYWGGFFLIFSKPFCRLLIFFQPPCYLFQLFSLETCEFGASLSQSALISANPPGMVADNQNAICKCLGSIPLLAGREPVLQARELLQHFNKHSSGLST